MLPGGEPVCRCYLRGRDFARGVLGMEPTRPIMSVRRVLTLAAAATAVWPATAVASPTCFGHKVTIKGTLHNDTIVGTDGPDVINTYDGNDVIDGRGGNDLICSGNGNDIVQGGAGNGKSIELRGDEVLVGDYMNG